MTEDFDNKVIEILEIIGDNPEANIPKCADKIHALADDVRSTPIFKDGGKTGTEFFKECTQVEIYNHMITKIAESPTKFHAVAAIILTIPYLSDKLNGAGQKVENEVQENGY